AGSLLPTTTPATTASRYAAAVDATAAGAWFLWPAASDALWTAVLPGPDERARCADVRPTGRANVAGGSAAVPGADRRTHRRRARCAGRSTARQAETSALQFQR